MTAAVNAMPPRPPTTPPTMAPVLDEFELPASCATDDGLLGSTVTVMAVGASLLLLLLLRLVVLGARPVVSGGGAVMGMMGRIDILRLVSVARYSKEEVCPTLITLGLFRVPQVNML